MLTGGTSALWQSDAGDKLACTQPCTAVSAALQMNCCTREENWACMAGSSLEILSGAFVTKWLGGSKELLFDADVDGGIVVDVVDGGVVYKNKNIITFTNSFFIIKTLFCL